MGWIRKTKINQLYVSIFCYQNILELQISMSNAILVAVFHSAKYLSKDFSCFGLIETPIVYYVVEQGTVFNLFHDCEIDIIPFVDPSSII